MRHANKPEWGGEMGSATCVRAYLEAAGGAGLEVLRLSVCRQLLVHHLKANRHTHRQECAT